MRVLVDAESVLASLTAAVQPWSDLFANNATLATAVTATHVLAIFAGGGIAVAADRRVLGALRVHDTVGIDAGALDELRRSHAIVIGALAVAASSGLLLLTSDLGTFGVSRVFWAKMATLALLLANGLRLRRAESRRAAGPLRQAALASLVLWFVLVLLGVILGNG